MQFCCSLSGVFVSRCATFNVFFVCLCVCAVIKAKLEGPGKLFRESKTLFVSSSEPFSFFFLSLSFFLSPSLFFSLTLFFSLSLSLFFLSFSFSLSVLLCSVSRTNPFCEVIIDGLKEGSLRTETLRKNASPQWDDEFTV